MRIIGTETIYELSDFFKIIGDVTRIRLLIALEETEMCVGELAEELGMTKSAVSHQLKTLRGAKLVRAENAVRMFSMRLVITISKRFWKWHLSMSVNN